MWKLWLALLAAGSLVSPATAVFRGSVEDASALAAGTWAPAPAWPLEISPGTSSPFGSPGGSASRIAALCQAAPPLRVAAVGPE